MLEKTEAQTQAEPTKPRWYQDALIYEVHVRAFYDSDGDGTGDFRGLAEKLDYLQGLGITAIWLLPFYPSPLKDDGYDITDYRGVHPSYGTLRDFKLFVREAHKRGLKVITELVCNHTSDQHPWFQRARHARPGSSARDFYVWSATAEEYRDARIIFKDFEPSNWSWDPVAGAHYWHRFFSHQPDLNFENPRVKKELFRAVDFWLGIGVDGLRLDAVPYLFEREGTNCENLPETHAFLKELRRHIDENFEDRMLLAEANQWPEHAADYFGGGEECHMAFHFPLMPRLFMALRMEDRYPIVDILAQTPELPEGAQWAVFLRNHDELTLEMVTESERSYMYRTYADDPQARVNLGIRRRLAPLLGNHRRRIELLNALLFSLPGTPVLYYGDEIGMGDNIYLGDRSAVRTPMQWSADRNAGFSMANRQKLYLPVIVDPEYHYEAVNVASQLQNPHSLLNWMKRLIALRKRHHALSRGTLEFLSPENARVLAFLRLDQDETVLVVANLSRFAQAAALDLSDYDGYELCELFSGHVFAHLTKNPYTVTLGPHDFFWFALRPQGRDGVQKPRRTMNGNRERHLQECIAELPGLLPTYLKSCRWYGGKERTLKSAMVRSALRIPGPEDPTVLCLVQCDYTSGDSQIYTLPLMLVRGQQAKGEWQEAVIAEFEAADGPLLLVDALRNPAFGESLLTLIRRRRTLKDENGGELQGLPATALRSLIGSEAIPASEGGGGDQSNSSMLLGDRLLLKLLRRVEEGVHPDVEISRFLSERTTFRHTAPFAGWLRYQPQRGGPIAVAALQGFVRSGGDAFAQAQTALRHSFDAVRSRPGAPGVADMPRDLLSNEAPSPLAIEVVGSYLEAARLLGRRTAELHLALSSDSRDSEFAPEAFTLLHQRSLYQSTRSQATRALRTLRTRLMALPGQAGTAAQALCERTPEIDALLRPLLQKRLDAERIRLHGDYHLAQVLAVDGDYIIVDFEGEPARSIEERRLKQSPLKDVAGMLRSFDYAAHIGLSQQVELGASLAALKPWARLWSRCSAAAFTGAYLETIAARPLLPPDKEDVRLLLNTFLLEKAIYEIGYELAHRPGLVGIPIEGALEILGAGSPA